MHPADPGAPHPTTSRAAGAADAVDSVRRLVALNNRAVFATGRRDGSIQASLVRVSVLDHPLTGQPTAVLLLRPTSVKLRNLRRNPRVALCLHAGSQWLTVEGRVTLLGPDDPATGLTAQHYRQTRRAHFLATVGEQESQAEWDLKMGGPRAALVFLPFDRIYTNPAPPPPTPSAPA
jgi:PPOX class probable F420-dependent enzyme